MAELRTDPLTGRSVVIASNRAGRPNEFRPSRPRDPSPSYHADCPFCAGNEHQTPESLLTVGDPWRRRVVNNKYPLCAPPGTPDAFCGAHEVIIESREHLQTTSELGVEGLEEVLGVYAQRLNHWRDDPRLPFRMVFKNVGPSAGASLSHLHSQFVALPQLSPQMKTELGQRARLPVAPIRLDAHWLEDQLSDGRPPRSRERAV